jgi:hypothetical protein
LTVTAREADPPALLRTVTFTGFADQLISKRPPDRVPISTPLDVTYASSVAAEFDDVASTRRRLPSYSARLMVTVSAGGGVPAGFTVSVAVRVTPPPAAEITGVWVAVTDVVATVNVALVAPAATVTLAGTDAEGWLLERLTTTPLAGAGPESVTVPVEPAPPVTVDGSRPSADTEVDSAGGGGSLETGSSVRVAVRVTPPPETEISTTVRVVTCRVEW